MRSHIVLITGGARSGKSRYAQLRALQLSACPVYLATARRWDEDFGDRIRRHQQDRDERWLSLEEEKYLSNRNLAGKVVVIDCVTLWLTNFFADTGQDPEASLAACKQEMDKLSQLVQANKETVLLFVSNEIGMGLHADTEAGRKFTDLQGWMNQYIAALADEVIFLVSGLPLLIKSGESSQKDPATHSIKHNMELSKKIQHTIDTKTKPLGSLGRLEGIAWQVGMIQGTDHPTITLPHILVFAGDHGIAATGFINPYPQAVTAQMVLNFIRGGAAINVFCRQQGIGLWVIDAGVNADFGAMIPEDQSGTTGFIRVPIARGTKNYLEEPAMRPDELQKALEKGSQLVDELAKKGCNCIGLGEMGIGNSSSAALIMSLLTGIPVAACAGRGTGANDEQLRTKIETLEKVIAFHFPGWTGSPSISGYPSAGFPAPETILQKVGGFEIAMMTGAYLRAAALKMVIVVDGFIASSALLTARALDPRVMDYCIFAHTSGEQGHVKMLEFLGAKPLLNLGMRLGEGTGAAMALPLIRSSVAFLNEMASFEEAGVDQAREGK